MTVVCGGLMLRAWRFSPVVAIVTLPWIVDELDRGFLGDLSGSAPSPGSAVVGKSMLVYGDWVARKFLRTP